MLVASFLVPFLCALSFPTVNQKIFSNITPKIISINSIIICVAIIILGKLWKKYETVLYKHFDKFLIAESVSYCVIVSSLLYSKINYYEYFLMDTIIFAVITKSIHFGCNTLKAQYFIDLEERKNYDNDGTIYGSAGTLLGSVLNIIVAPSVTISFLLVIAGVSVDNIIYLYLFYTLNKKEDLNYGVIAQLGEH